MARRALVIGIDRYPHLPEDRQLEGCVRDAREMVRVLTTRYRFPGESVDLLLDGQATRSAILAAMDRLAGQVRTDDVVVFSFSGHGSRMTDREGDEPDGWDETILPCDSGRAPAPNRDITDDEICEWLLRVSDLTSNITLILDSCHAGSMTRLDHKVRGVEDDTRPAEELPPSPIRVLRGAGDRSPGSGGWLPRNSRYVLLAACRNHELAREAVFEGAPRGAFSYYLVHALERARPGLSYRELYEEVAPLVTRRFEHQHPQLEGARDLEVFGTARIEPLRFSPEESADRYRRALALSNPGSRLRGAVDLILRRRDPWLGWVPVDAAEALETGFVEGEALAFEILNRSGRALFVYVLDFGLAGAIHQVYPVEGSWDPLAPGLCIRSEHHGDLHVHVPDGAPAGIETLKLFAATHSVDLRPLCQGGPARRGVRLLHEPPRNAGEEDWTTVQRPFRVRRAGSATTRLDWRKAP